MKDKRQRIAIAWPYAAVYSDPAFAASILQAAANSVGMPYGYGGSMLPQGPLMGHQMPANRLGYGFPPSVRYNPYPIPIPPQGYGGQAGHGLRNESSQASSVGSPVTASGAYSNHGMPHSQQSPGLSANEHPLIKSPKDAHNSSVSPLNHDIRSPTASSQSTSSLSPDSDRMKCDFGGSAEGTPLKCNGAMKGGLGHQQEDKTIISSAMGSGGDKPNLFRPYKSEA